MDLGSFVCALEDPALVCRLAASGIPLTVRPLSNLRLRGVPDLRRYPLKRMLDAGLKATANSDDPSCFGGYLLDNFVAIAEAIDLGRPDLLTLARNSIEGSFLHESARKAHLARFDQAAAFIVRPSPPRLRSRAGARRETRATGGALSGDGISDDGDA